METLGLTQKIMAKMPKIACNWSSWAKQTEAMSHKTKPDYGVIPRLAVPYSEQLSYRLQGEITRILHGSPRICRCVPHHAKSHNLGLSPAQGGRKIARDLACVRQIPRIERNG